MVIRATSPGYRSRSRVYTTGPGHLSMPRVRATGLDHDPCRGSRSRVLVKDLETPEHTLRSRLQGTGPSAGHRSRDSRPRVQTTNPCHGSRPTLRWSFSQNCDPSARCLAGGHHLRGKNFHWPVQTHSWRRLRVGCWRRRFPRWRWWWRGGMYSFHWDRFRWYSVEIRRLSSTLRSTDCRADLPLHQSRSQTLEQSGLMSRINFFD